MAADSLELELTIVGAEGLKNVKLLGKMSPCTIAWIDPRLKKSTKTLHNSGRDPVWNETISLSVPIQILSNPNAALIIQVLSAAHFKSKIIGSTTLLLSDIKRICSVKGRDLQETFTLQLWRPSGRAHGILTVTLNLKGNAIFDTGGLTHYEQCWARICPPSYDIPVQGIPVTALSSQGLPPLRAPSDEVEYGTSVEQCAYSDAYMPLPPTAPPLKQSNASKNFFIGLLSGAVAAVLVGSAML